MLGFRVRPEAQDGNAVESRQVKVEHYKVEIQFLCHGARLLSIG
jgi:hypothetical protein